MLCDIKVNENNSLSLQHSLNIYLKLVFCLIFNISIKGIQLINAAVLYIEFPFQSRTKVKNVIKTRKVIAEDKSTNNSFIQC